MKKKYSFPKSEKLTEKKSIDAIFKTKKMVFKFPFKILYLGKENVKPPKTLISVPKRSFKKAVDRNLLKRRIREGYRLHKYILQISQKEENQKEEKHIFVCESLAFMYIAKEILPSEKIHEKIIFLLNEIKKNSYTNVENPT